MEDQMNTELRTVIARNFSLGNFKTVYEHLADTVQWNIVGEKLLNGIEEVKTHCVETAAYFDSVQTDFSIDKIIVDELTIVITGHAVFVRNGITVSRISSCDIYEFNSVDNIIEVTSYCIKNS